MEDQRRTQLATLASLLASANTLGEYFRPLAGTRLQNCRGYQAMRSKLRNLAGTGDNWGVAINWWLRELTECGALEAWLQFTEAEQKLQHGEIRRLAKLTESDLIEEMVDELEAKMNFNNRLEEKAHELFFLPRPEPPRQREEDLNLNGLFRARPAPLPAGVFRVPPFAIDTSNYGRQIPNDRYCRDPACIPEDRCPLIHEHMMWSPFYCSQHPMNCNCALPHFPNHGDFN